MRNLRKLSAVVVAIALVLTSMTAAFAASGSSNEFEAQATVLKDLGIWQGNADGDLMLGEKLTRAQGAVLVLKTVLGKTDADMKAADTAALSTFVDAEEVPAWAEGWVALAIKEKVLKGTTDGELAAGAPLKGKDLASMFMNALGYASENEYGKAVELLAAKSTGKILAGIVADITDADLTRDAATAVVYDTLLATAKDAKQTVIVTYVGTDAAKKAAAEKAGLIVAPTGLDVSKVEASNLRELVITFNKAVPNADNAKKKENYEVKNPDGTVLALEAATLSDDSKTVTLRTTSASHMTNYATDVQLTVKKAAGVDADKTIKGITVKDTAVPTLVSAKTTGPKNIKVTLSEPIDEPAVATNLTSAFKIDGGTVGFASVTVSGVDLSIKTYSDLSEGSHKLEVVTPSNVKDNAGYPLQGTTLTFDYVKDTSPLTVKISESNETSVTLEFSKAIDTTTFIGNANVKVAHTYADLKPILGSDKFGDGTAKITTSDDVKFKVDFTGNPFPPSTVNLYITYVDGAKQLIQDNYGNKLAATTLTINTAADTTKPTATAEFVDASTVKVTYSEDVQSGTGTNGANNTYNYELKSGTDTVFITTANFDADSNSVVLLKTNPDALNGSSYTVKIKNIKDKSVAQNQLDEVTLTFTGTDKVAPDVDSAGLASTNKIRIKYTEAMDVASITDKTVYRINGTVLGDKDTVEATDGNKTAVITLNTTPTTGTTYVLSIGRVKDVAGNWSKFFQKDVSYIGNNVDKVPLEEYQQVAVDGIKVIVNDTLQSIQWSDFEYSTVSGIFVPVKNIKELSIVDGKTYITLVTEDLGTNTVGTNLEVRTADKSGKTVSAQNAYGSKLSFNTVTDTKVVNGATVRAFNITDKCPAKLVGISAFDLQTPNKSVGKALRSVTLTYSENIYASSVADSDYTVDGYAVDKVVVSANTVTVFVKNVDYGTYVKGTDIKVKQVGEIEDTARNVLGAQDEVKANSSTFNYAY